MPLMKINCLRDLYQVIESKKKEIIPTNEIWTLFQKYDIYHKCESHQNDNQNVWRYTHKDHKILYFILEKLYVTKSTDADLIVAVIKRIFKEGIYFNNLISDLFKESKNFETDEICQMLEYFLKYTYMKKMVFDGFRMANFNYFFPVNLLPDYQYTLSLPTIMGILLRHGMLLDPITGQGPTLGDMFDTDIYTRRDIPNTHISLWYSIINEGILCCNPHLLPASQLKRKQKKIFNLSLEVANMIIRDSVKIRLSVFNFSLDRLHTFLKYGYDWYDSNDDSDIDSPNVIDETDTMEFINLKSYHTNIVDLVQKLGSFMPELPKRCLEPTSLKHFCKQVIRKVLHLNWQLPNGIYNLNLPMILVRYLNLETD